MESEASPVALRPLHIGELLDRAVAISVRYFWVLAPLQLAFALVFGLSDFAYSHRHQETLGEEFIPMLGKSHSPGTADSPAWLAPAYVVLLGPLAAAPGLWIVASLARGRTGAVSLSDTTRAALRAWPGLMGVNAIYGIVAAVFVLIAAIPGAIIVGTVRANGLGVGAIVVVATVFGAPAALAAVGFGIAYMLAQCASVAEPVNAWQASLSGLRRAFADAQRSLTFGLACVALLLGDVAITEVAADLMQTLLHNEALTATIQQLPGVVVSTVINVFAMAFYFDARVRQEGYDLQVAIDSEGAWSTGR